MLLIFFLILLYLAFGHFAKLSDSNSLDIPGDDHMSALLTVLSLLYQWLGLFFLSYCLGLLERSVIVGIYVLIMTQGGMLLNKPDF